MNESNIVPASEETINTTENLVKELIVEQVQFTDDLESTNINYLNYLIIG
jgi:hypothetical protein